MRAASGSSDSTGCAERGVHAGRRRSHVAARSGRAGHRPERRRRLRGPPSDALGARAGRHARAREQGEPRRSGRARARRAGAGRRPLLPVDSEHSAVFQCLEGREPESVDPIVLTASGGPFRGRARDELADVTRADALAHPTWSMGPKITIDSATLANKGLELIEAHFLFGLPYERIEVVVHPTSVVHALVRFRDGASLAHLGYPDMRVRSRTRSPIPSARRRRSRARLRGRAHPRVRGPGCGDVPHARPRARGRRVRRNPSCAYNAANEVAVAAFLAGRLPFLGSRAWSRKSSPRSTVRRQEPSRSSSRPTATRVASRKETPEAAA